MSRCPLELPPREVHVWTVRLETTDAIAAKLEGILSPDERERAARFRFDDLRRSFAVARGALRCLLGGYLDIEPAGIKMQYGPKGKPALAGGEPMEFNLAHSGGMAAFAFTRGCPIGIDLERIREIPDMAEIAARYFCAEENTEIMSLPRAGRERAFFCCWTRKEAYVKATGEGLSALGPCEAAQAWTVQNLSLEPEYAAALAYRDRERPLALFPMADPAELIDEP
jgi:4'-phosphopantetheinyl transferase